jgi:hypothetical protein
MGEPEPTDIAVGRKGDLYWTCKTAGVILERDAHGEVGVLIGGLNSPSGSRSTARAIGSTGPRCRRPA